MRRYTPEQIEALTNWDSLLCQPPFRSPAEQRQYYSRFVERMLWRYFVSEDWRIVATIVDSLRVSPKLKRATQYLLSRHPRA